MWAEGIYNSKTLLHEVNKINNSNSRGVVREKLGMWPPLISASGYIGP